MTAPQEDGGAVASARDAARSWLHAYGIDTSGYTVRGDDHPMMDTLSAAFEAFAAARPAPAGEAAEVDRLVLAHEADYAQWQAELEAKQVDYERLGDAYNATAEALTAAEAILAQARAENERLRQGKDRFKVGVRAAVTWLHARARTMADPKAQAVLNSAATNLGWGLATARGQVRHPLTGDHHVLDTDTGSTVETRRDGPAPGVPVVERDDGGRDGE